MDYSPIILGLTVANTAGLGFMVWKQNSEQQKIKNQMVVDTSGLIDGRIIEIVSSGFVPPRLIIPQFVVAELQFLADQGDAYKRERARYGLDIVRRLQDMRQTEVVIRPGMAKGIKEVDNKLVALAKKTGALLYTTDFNLNQVAQIEGVRVLNVNELAQGVRAMHLPGEKREIKITQLGQDRTQGVGYLEDGTMVVVERAAKYLNQHAAVEFTRMLQTQAGKMMFATLAGTHHSKPAYEHHDKKPQAPAAPAPQVAVVAPERPERKQQPAPAPQPQAYHSEQHQPQAQKPRNNNRRYPQKRNNAQAITPRPTRPTSASHDAGDGHVKL